MAGMALRHAILSALIHRDASGYDLAKVFDAAVSSYWSATPQQLYRELDRLSGDGLVEARVVQQERRPNKRVYSVTDAGRNELHAFVARAPRPLAIRDELLVQVTGMGPGDVESVRANLAAKLEASEAKLEIYQRAIDRALDGRSEEEFLDSGELIGSYLVLQRGVAYERETIAWCRSTLKILARRS